MSRVAEPFAKKVSEGRTQPFLSTQKLSARALLTHPFHFMPFHPPWHYLQQQLNNTAFKLALSEYTFHDYIKGIYSYSLTFQKRLHALNFHHVVHQAHNLQTRRDALQASATPCPRSPAGASSRGRTALRGAGPLRGTPRQLPRSRAAASPGPLPRRCGTRHGVSRGWSGPQARPSPVPSLPRPLTVASRSPGHRQSPAQGHQPRPQR